MRTRFFLQLGWLAAAANCAFCGEANDPTPVSQERLRALVQQLGADSFEQRDAAQEELARAGERALEVLEAAQKGSDPEIRVRVLRLLQPLRFRAASLVEWKTMQELLGPLLGAKTLDAPAPAAAAKVSPNARAAPDPSLQWLAEAQENDGHWDSRKHGAEEDADIEQTSFALLAFLGAGHTEKRGDYKLNVQRATGWLKDRIREDGAIVRAGQKEPDGLVHTLAGLALAEAAGMANMPGTKKAAQKAVEYTAGRLQRFEGEQRGGFGRAPNAEQCDLLTTTLAVMHIKSAKVAGLHVAPGAFDGSIRFLDQMENRELGYSLAPGLPPSARATIMGCFCRQFLGWRKEDLQAHAARAVRVGGRAAMVPSDDLCKWFAALMLFQQGGDLWKSYNESLLQEVAARRVQEGENAGSVDPRGPLAKGGRVLSTALVTLAVEVYYRYVQLHE